MNHRVAVRAYYCEVVELRLAFFDGSFAKRLKMMDMRKSFTNYAILGLKVEAAFRYFAHKPTTISFQRSSDFVATGAPFPMPVSPEGDQDVVAVA